MTEHETFPKEIVWQRSLELEGCEEIQIESAVSTILLG